MANWKKICIFFTFSLLICICIAVIVIVLRPYKAVVAADSKICSEVGREILKEGGSAADAAIAALLCTSVVNPQSTGIGGGSVFTIMSKNGSVKIINSRETVPKAVKEDLLSDCPCSETGGIVWMGVPGEIRGYERVHRLYGRLPWSRLFQPTIRLAREGVKMSKIVARYLHVIKNRGARQLFEDEKGRMLKEGDTMKFEELADTLEEIAENGADEFYTGETAEKLLCDMQRAGGSITLEDLRSVEVSELEPWKVSLGDYTMYFPPPPSGASVVSFILNVMEGYNLNPASLERKERVLTYHRYVEACKFANAQRKLMKDPRFNNITKAYAITEKEFADRIRKMITDDQTHDNQYYNVTPEVDTQGTSHVSVLDEDGMAVSVTSSINYLFGCGEFSPQTGVIFNNQLADFCDRADKIQTGERPPSSMAPMILRSTKTDDLIIIGGSGGTMITTGVTMALMNYLWFGNSLKHSIAEPVVFVDGKNRLSFETDFDEEVIEALKDRKDTVKYKKYFYNVVNAISKRGGTIYAYSDIRKDGEAAGY